MVGKTVLITQSNYLPWKGYFHAIDKADEFIVLDEVQYTRRDWRNRNQVKTANGLQWLTIPVQVKGKYDQSIREVRVADQSWRRKHWRTLVSSYSRAPCFDAVSAGFETFYREHQQETLSEINRYLIEHVCGLLGIDTRITQSSDYAHGDGRTGRLLDLCRQSGASVYLSGPAAKAYLDVERFNAEGIDVQWMDYSGYPPYPQLHGDFEHHVSIVDTLFHLGEDARGAVCV